METKECRYCFIDRELKNVPFSAIYAVAIIDVIDSQDGDARAYLKQIERNMCEEHRRMADSLWTHWPKKGNE